MPRRKPGKRVNHGQILLYLPPALLEGLKDAAVEKSQTYSALAAVWLQEGLAKHLAEKGAPESRPAKGRS
jgi:hypothetical protein